MLTKKELLNYKKSKGKIIPTFINPDDPLLNEFSETLVSYFSTCHGLNRENIEQAVEQIITTFTIDPVVQKGLLKLLFDRLTFESSYEGEISEFRNSIFLKTNSILKSSKILEFSEFKKEVICDLKYKVDEVEYMLYSDLPSFHKATTFKEITPKGLLNRYNIALVQGLLFYCEHVQILIPATDNAKLGLRYLLKQIRFFQLIVKIEKQDSSFEIILDGPLSLFLQTQKYGFNLASFFPSLVLLPEWELMASIEIGKGVRQQGTLNLSNADPLISHFKNYSAYVPEEFEMFEKLFSEKSTSWELITECEEVLFDGEVYFFPDYCFLNSDKKIYLELFHSWHKSSLKQRVININKKIPCELIIGVAKSLLKDNEINELIENSIYFKKHGFLFREMPTVNQVFDVLKRFV